MTHIDIGVIGIGGLGTHMADQFAAIEDVSVAALADVSEANLSEGGDRFDVPERARYDDYREMLEAEPLDAIQVTTPHAFHHEQVVAGLERDLHVYCEKPLVTDLEDARDLLRRDASTDLTLMVGYQRHLDPAFLVARERYADGDLAPEFMTVEITQDLFGGQSDSWYLDPDLSGGGQIYATGTHVIDALLWCTGLKPVSVTAALDLEDGIDRLDKHAALTLRFANDAVATVAISGDTPRTREHHHYWDAQGAVYIDGREWDQRTVRTIDADGVERSPYIAGPERDKAEAFVESIREGTEPPATARDALRATAVQEAAYEADRTGESVEVDVDH